MAKDQATRQKVKVKVKLPLLAQSQANAIGAGKQAIKPMIVKTNLNIPGIEDGEGKRQTIRRFRQCFRMVMPTNDKMKHFKCQRG